MIRIAVFLVPMLGIGVAQAADLPEVLIGAAPAFEMAQDQSEPTTQLYAACRNAIAEWAQAYSPVEMDVVNAGRVEKYLNGTRVVPLNVRIVYEVEGGYETRKADVKCTIDRADTVAVVSRPRN